MINHYPATGEFCIDKVNAKAAIASALGFSGYEPLKAEISHFIRAVNVNADTSKNVLVITYHKTLKGAVFKGTPELVALFPGIEIDEDIQLYEGWEVGETLKRTAFDESIRINNFAFAISEEAISTYEDHKYESFDESSQFSYVEIREQEKNPFEDIFSSSMSKLPSKTRSKTIPPETVKPMIISIPKVTTVTDRKSLNSDNNFTSILLVWGIVILFFCAIITFGARTRSGCVCYDRTNSYATSSGACSHHGGVMYWTHKYWWDK